MNFPFFNEKDKNDVRERPQKIKDMDFDDLKWENRDFAAPEKRKEEKQTFNTQPTKDELRQLSLNIYLESLDNNSIDFEEEEDSLEDRILQATEDHLKSYETFIRTVASSNIAYNEAMHKLDEGIPSLS